MKKSGSRILVYRIGHIGDTVIALPALWAIRKRFSQAHITLLCNEQSGSGHVPASKILPESGLIDDTLAYESYEKRLRPVEWLRLLRTLRRLKYDTLVYLAPRLRQPAAVLRDLAYFRLAGIRKFHGHKGFGLPPRTGEHPLQPTDHESDHLLKRLSCSGIPVPEVGNGVMDLEITDRERTAASDWLQREIPGANPGMKLVGIAPGSKWPSKVWPEERFMELGRRLVYELGLYPIVLGGGDDVELGSRLIKYWGTGTNFAGTLEVRLTASVLKFCRLYVGNDTGAMHLAAAVGTPCVVLMSAQDWPGRWEPYGKGHIVLRKSVPCEGCLLSICEREGLRCLKEIEVGEVIQACNKVILRDSPLANYSTESVYERATC